MLILIAVLAGMQLWTTWSHRHYPAAQAYRMASMETRIGYAAMYVALVGFLAVMTYDVHEMLQTAARVQGHSV